MANIQLPILSPKLLISRFSFYLSARIYFHQSFLHRRRRARRITNSIEAFFIKQEKLDEIAIDRERKNKIERVASRSAISDKCKSWVLCLRGGLTSAVSFRLSNNAEHQPPPTMEFHLHLWLRCDAQGSVVVTLLGRRALLQPSTGQMWARRTTALVKNWIYLRAGAWNSNSTRNIHGRGSRCDSRAIIDISIERRELLARRRLPHRSVDSIWRREMTSERKYYITRDFGRLKVPPAAEKKRGLLSSPPPPHVRAATFDFHGELSMREPRGTVK